VEGAVFGGGGSLTRAAQLNTVAIVRRVVLEQLASYLADVAELGAALDCPGVTEMSVAAKVR
jgi:hypothetical protein